MNFDTQERVVVAGAGPAGLTAAHTLARLGMPSIVLEKTADVGGLARTESYRNFRFDMGGHRFYTKSRRVMDLWEEVLGDDFLVRPRLSRIYYRKRFFYYPLRALNALAGLGLLESTAVMLSYARARLFPQPREESFEDWVTHRFGRRLFEIFFKSYTEKVWGLSCTELRAEWAAQRIQDLSLMKALLDMVPLNRGKVRSLIEEFHYPRHGPGMMWQKFQKQIEEMGSEIELGTSMKRVHISGRRITEVVVADRNGERTLPCSHLVSSIPLRSLIRRMDPQPPQEILDAAEQLSYRDFLTVCLIVDSPEVFPDNWIYVHDPEVQVGRIQNYKNWSPDMVPNPEQSGIGLEYFCNEGDSLWTLSNSELIELATKELDQLGLVPRSAVKDGCVYRVPKAYPIYDTVSGEGVETLRQYCEGFENLYCIGRNGQHRYNNQDHSMLTGILAAESLASGTAQDLWDVNTEQDYLEEVRA